MNSILYVALWSPFPIGAPAYAYNSQWGVFHECLTNLFYASSAHLWATYTACSTGLPNYSQVSVFIVMQPTTKKLYYYTSFKHLPTPSACTLFCPFYTSYRSGHHFIIHWRLLATYLHTCCPALPHLPNLSIHFNQFPIIKTKVLLFFLVYSLFILLQFCLKCTWIYIILNRYTNSFLLCNCF